MLAVGSSTFFVEPASSRDRPNQVADILAVSAMRDCVPGYDTSSGYVRVNEVANWLKHSAYRRYGLEWGWSPRRMCFESLRTERSLVDSRQISREMAWSRQTISFQVLPDGDRVPERFGRSTLPAHEDGGAWTPLRY